MRNRYISTFVALATVGCLLLLFGCGGGSSHSTPPPVVAISVSPATSTVSVNQTQQFTATVTGTTNTAVRWSVTEASGGTIDAAGLYKAPLLSGTYHVVATSLADTTKTASATLTVNAPAPTFSSTAPASAVVATAYSYAVSATDPAGTAVTLALTTSPTGATLTGNTVAWTPTVAQIGQTNSFTVTATSAAGGSATQSWTVTVTAATPSFTSTAPTDASEGTLYSYAITATDPAGTKVTLSLTTAPTGAALNGNTLTWTPTADQSRVANSFKVTATAETGASSSQSWTVTPTGTIRGTYVENFWTATGMVPVPQNLAGSPNFSIAALVPQSDGSLKVLPATQNLGAFTIDNVPAGHYWLQMSPTEMYWTDSSAFDYGSDFAGRHQPDSVLVPMNFAFNLTGLDTWAAGDELWIGSPNADWFAPSPSPTVGATSFSASQTLIAAPLDPTEGDSSVVLEYESATGLASPFTASVLGPALALPNLTVDSGTTNNIGGGLSSTPQSIDFNIKGSAWAPLMQKVGAGTTFPQFFGAYLSLQPFVYDRAARAGGPPLTTIVTPEPLGTILYLAWAQNSDTFVNADIDAGTVQYNNPFPSTWLPVYSAQQGALVPVTPTQNHYVNFGSSTTTADSGFAPVIGPVQNPKMNGADLFTTATSSATAVTLSWDAPALGTAYGYHVRVESMDSTSGAFTKVADLYTPATSITVPPTLLTAGNTYVFLIEAKADAGANMASSPWRSKYPTGFAQVVSAPLTIGSGATTATIVGNKSLLVVKPGQTPFNRASQFAAGAHLLRR